ncbi:probable E3 ubiquitin-protein ligase RNF217 [Abrus precatorius]|uniref:RBR-type E3 ubiquitin transferase n=1 Tax=Abrus precatorius TaxID=3816 RepID=A0A8B8K247_ABRPR|nr:probable E3 ubiquitin-protein ligase RNF217 [Abrus precatorius]
MFFKANMQARTEQEQQDPGASRPQLLFTLLEQVNKLINLIKNWFQQQIMAQAQFMGYQNLLKTKSPLDHDHDHVVEAKKIGQPSQFLCGICFDHKPVSDMFKQGKCNHPFCTICISKHVATQIHQNILKVNCPNPNCSMELKPEFLHTILPKEVIVRWETARCEALIVGSEKTYCPFKDCSVLLLDDGGKVVISAECPSCHRLFCAQCRVPWHGGWSCKEYQRLKKSRDEKELDKKFLKLAKGKMWQKCPQCAMFVQRRGGCEHMTCRCGCNFCYNCGGNWKFGHICKKSRST